jgi:hypothetical protein
LKVENLLPRLVTVLSELCSLYQYLELKLPTNISLEDMYFKYVHHASSYPISLSRILLVPSNDRYLLHGLKQYTKKISLTGLKSLPIHQEFHPKLVAKVSVARL